ncbi:MAG TPA: hypothetical protein VKZ89_03005 [Thermobifida alba]|nr:hypothetical protein [Thermobifida alba]
MSEHRHGQDVHVPPYTFSDRAGDYLMIVPAKNGGGIELIVTEAKTRRRAAVTIPASRLPDVVDGMYRKAGLRAPLLIDPDEVASDWIRITPAGGA